MRMGNLAGVDLIGLAPRKESFQPQTPNTQKDKSIWTHAQPQPQNFESMLEFESVWINSKHSPTSKNIEQKKQ